MPGDAHGGHPDHATAPGLGQTSPVPTASIPTVWVLGDQLARQRGALAGREPGSCRVLLVESHALVMSRPWHRQRLHLVLSAMEHFAAELLDEGFDVDHRRAASLADGLREHTTEYGVDRVIAMEPSSWSGRRLLERLGVELVRNDLFLCHYDEFADWAAGRTQLRMEDFYRWQRQRLGVLIEVGADGPEPVGGRWNFDHDNRQPPPRDGRDWPQVERFALDDIDRSVIARLPAGTAGTDPDGTWPVTRAQAQARLAEFVDHGLAPFGPHEDAMLRSEWKLAHSVLSSSMNLGLLHPGEIVAAVERAWHAGDAPINSVEGFVRQVIGWREYVWGVYWLWMPGYRGRNGLDADAPRSAGVHRCGGHRDGVRRRRRRACCRPWLRPPHRTVDGARQSGAHRRRRSAGDDRLDVGVVRRRGRVGDAAERRRHGAATPTAG